VPPQPNCPPAGVLLSKLVTQVIRCGVTSVPQSKSDDLLLKRLPHTLYDTTRITATSYSKVLRGLRFPLKISGLRTRKKCSEDSSWGQWGPRCALHARHHSNDKAFRYLKRVIVTPAVKRSLDPLNRVFGYRHWADVTGCTRLYSLAAGCVFGKQSDPPS
jgi:hypothetical protein